MPILFYTAELGPALSWTAVVQEELGLNRIVWSLKNRIFLDRFEKLTVCSNFWTLGTLSRI